MVYKKLTKSQLKMIELVKNNKIILNERHSYGKGGAAFHYFSGSKENIQQRVMNKLYKIGLINKYGLITSSQNDNFGPILETHIIVNEVRLEQFLVTEKVYGYKTKHKEGFIKSEIDGLLKFYPNIDMDKFNSALCGITCMLKDNETIIYHCDIKRALHCGIEKRDLKSYEFD